MKKWSEPTRTVGSRNLKFELSKRWANYQAREVHKLFPSFKCVLKLPWHVAWIGTVEPMFQKYVVRIDYRPGASDENFVYGVSSKLVREAMVTCLEPDLILRHPDTKATLPHLYRYPREGLTAEICLHLGDWVRTDSIAEFIIPWISDWFANYELWLVTGKWLGREASHDPMDKPEDNKETAEKCSTPGSIKRLEKARIRKFYEGNFLKQHPYFFSRYC